MSSRPRIVDAQVHAWGPDSAEAPWRIIRGDSVYNTARAHFIKDIWTWERVLAAMDDANVDAAVFFSPGLIYGDDPTYGLRAAEANPGRFAVVVPVLPGEEDLADKLLGWGASPHILGIRVLAYTDAVFEQLCDGRAARTIQAAGNHGLAVHVYAPGYLHRLHEVASRYPDVQLVIDHLGLKQPPVMTLDDPSQPFAGFERLLELAKYPNVAVKATAIPTLSLESFPFADVWPYLHRLLDAFGVERVMWGTDATRVAEMLSYREGVDYVLGSEELSHSEKAAFLGGSLESIYGWVPAGRARAHDV